MCSNEFLPSLPWEGPRDQRTLWQPGGTFGVYIVWEMSSLGVLWGGCLSLWNVQTTFAPRVHQDLTAHHGKNTWLGARTGQFSTACAALNFCLASVKAQDTKRHCGNPVRQLCCESDLDKQTKLGLNVFWPFHWAEFLLQVHTPKKGGPVWKHPLNERIGLTVKSRKISFSCRGTRKHPSRKNKKHPFSCIHNRFQRDVQRAPVRVDTHDTATPIFDQPEPVT